MAAARLPRAARGGASLVPDEGPLALARRPSLERDGRCGRGARREALPFGAGPTKEGWPLRKGTRARAPSHVPSLTRALCSPLPFARVCSSLAGTSGGTWSFVPSLDMPAAATSKAQELARLQLGSPGRAAQRAGRVEGLYEACEGGEALLSAALARRDALRAAAAEEELAARTVEGQCRQRQAALATLSRALSAQRAGGAAAARLAAANEGWSAAARRRHEAQRRAHDLEAKLAAVARAAAAEQAKAEERLADALRKQARVEHAVNAADGALRARVEELAVLQAAKAKAARAKQQAIVLPAQGGPGGGRRMTAVSSLRRKRRGSIMIAMQHELTSVMGSMAASKMPSPGRGSSPAGPRGGSPVDGGGSDAGRGLFSRRSSCSRRSSVGAEMTQQAQQPAPHAPAAVAVSSEDLMTLDEKRLDVERIERMEMPAQRTALRRLSSRYEELGVLCGQLRRLLSATKTITSTLDMASAVERVASKAVEVLEAGSARVLLLDVSTNELVTFTDGDGDEEVRLPVGHGVLGHVLRTGQFYVSHDVASDRLVNARVDLPQERGRVRNMMAVSTRVDDDTYGTATALIQVFNKRNRASFTDKDVFLLSITAVQGSIALRNARLYDDARRKAATNQALLEVGKSLVSELDSTALLNLIVNRSRKLLDADRCSLFLVEGFELVSMVSDAGITNFRVPMASIVGQAATTGHVQNVRDAYADPRFDRKWDAKSGYRTRTLLAVPFFGSEGSVMGVIEMINKRSRAFFSHEDASILEAFGGQMAIAMENANLYVRMFDRPSVSTRLLVDVDQRTVLDEIVRETRRICPCEGVKLLMRADDGGRLWHFAGASGTAASHQGIQSYPVAGLAAAALTTNKVANVVEPSSQRMFYQGPDSFKEIGGGALSALTHMLVIPVFDASMGRCIAVLVLANKRQKRNGKGRRSSQTTQHLLAAAVQAQTFHEMDKKRPDLLGANDTAAAARDAAAAAAAAAVRNGGGSIGAPNTATAAAAGGSKTVAVPFDRQDEFMLRGYLVQASLMLQAALQRDEEAEFAERSAALNACVKALAEAVAAGGVELRRRDGSLDAWIERRVAKLVSTAKVAIFWYDVDKRWLQARGSEPQEVSDDPSAPLVARCAASMAPVAETLWVSADGQVQISAAEVAEKVQRDMSAYSLPVGLSFRAALCVPVVASAGAEGPQLRQRLLGVLGFNKSRQAGFSNVESKLLAQFGQHLGYALAPLFDTE